MIMNRTAPNSGDIRSRSSSAGEVGLIDEARALGLGGRIETEYDPYDLAPVSILRCGVEQSSIGPMMTFVIFSDLRRIRGAIFESAYCHRFAPIAAIVPTHLLDGIYTIMEPSNRTGFAMGVVRRSDSRYPATAPYVCCSRLKVLTSSTPWPRSESRKTIPAASNAFSTWWRVSSRTGSSFSDSSRLSAVKATRALSASISWVQPRSARAARTWREVIMIDHVHKPSVMRY